MSLPTTFANDLAAVALDQHAKFSGLHESNRTLCKQIQEYWKAVGGGFTSCTTVAWSAVFVSWCVKQAGATAAQFKFSARHSEFVHQAIHNAIGNTGVFRAFDITQHAPKVGDIIHNNRVHNSFDYSYASTHSKYESHSAIVVELGTHTNGDKFARTIGGNEGDSIRSKFVDLTPAGFIEQRTDNPFICVITNL